MEAHGRLWDTLQDAGVSVNTNSKDCNDKIDGYYHSRRQSVVVCQDNGVPGGEQVRWTANDLDTLRHEAQHVIQDCMVGSLGDMRSDTYFDREVLKEFLINSTLSADKLTSIVESYKEDGISEEKIIMELEAFAVAKDVDPDTIARAVVRYCM